MSLRLLPLVLSLCLLATPAAAQVAGPPAAPSPGPEADLAKVGHFGLQLALLGPASLLSGGLVYQVHPRVELNLGLGFQSASAKSDTTTATASASGQLITPFLRGRSVLLGERHGLLLEGGLAATRIKLLADGANSFGDSIHYERSGLVPMLLLGTGYNFRTEAGFRFALVAGYMRYLGGLGASTVTTTGSFDADDRARMRTSFDRSSDDLAKSRVYLELSFGWLF